MAISFLMSSPVFADTIKVWTYHEFPPFIVNEQAQTGLSYDLVELLTERSGGEHEFRLQVAPRERLNNRLKVKEPGIVLWVNPNWFDDTEQKNTCGLTHCFKTVTQ